MRAVVLWVAMLAGCSSGNAPATPVHAGSSSATSPEDAQKRAVLAIHGHVLILKAQPMFTDYMDVIATARKLDPEVVAAAPFSFVEAVVRSPRASAEVGLKGLAPERTRVRTDLEPYIQAGTIPSDATATGDVPLALGDAAARQLDVRVGDPVELEMNVTRDDPNATFGISRQTVVRRRRISGIVHTGILDLDGRLALTSLAIVQQLSERTGTVTGVELRLSHPDEAPRIAKQLQATLGAPYSVEDWCELNREFFHC